MKQRIVKAVSIVLLTKTTYVWNGLFQYYQLTIHSHFSIHRTIWNTVKHNRATADYRSYRALIMLQGASSEM